MHEHENVDQAEGLEFTYKSAKTNLIAKVYLKRFSLVN